MARTDPYGRGDQPEELKLAIRPLRPLRQLLWWMLLCDVADGSYRASTSHDDRCFSGFFKRMAVAAAFTVPWLIGGLFVGWVLPAIGGALFAAFWPTRVWVRVSLGLRSSASWEQSNDEDRVWRDDPTYEAWKDRLCR